MHKGHKGKKSQKLFCIIGSLVFTWIFVHSHCEQVEMFSLGQLPTYFCSTGQASDDLFGRLEIVFHLFTHEGDMENMGCGNTEHRGLNARVLT
jgi:hypothetical protein